MWGDIAIAFILAFVVTFVTTPYMIKIAKKVGAVDIPKDERRAHKKAIPKFGGPAVILGFLISTIYLLIVMSMEHTINLFDFQQYWKKLLGFLSGILIISAFCVVDDIKTIKPITKLTGQLIGAIIVAACGIRIEGITLPFINLPEIHEITSVLLTIAWIVIVTNAINLMDGLDGLSSGIAVISAISLMVIFVLNGSALISVVLITALAGALVGFLPFNFTPAKTFLGDTGSNFLGFSLAVISILGSAKTYTAAVIVLPLIVLGLPIFDTVWAIIRRLIKGVHIGDLIVNPHFHLVDKKGFIKDEGMVYYDILCYIDVPQEDGKNIRVYLNVEIQNNPYPGYSIITRGYTYISRIVSEQWGSEYDDKL